MDDIKTGNYIYSGTSLLGTNSYYKSINIDIINQYLCFYAHEDSVITITKQDINDDSDYYYVKESTILNYNNQGYDNQVNNGIANYSNGNMTDDMTSHFSLSDSPINIELNCGDRLYLWIESTNIVASKYNKITITGSGKHSVSGNVMSLFNNLYNNWPNYGYSIDFSKLFENNTGLYDASGLILYDAPNYSYFFNRCTQLRYPPKLPKIYWSNEDKHNVYESMFENCSNLIVAPDITCNYTYLSGNDIFKNMFKNCTSLIQAPDLDFYIDLPGKGKSSDGVESSGVFWGMFYGCTNMILGPKAVKCSCEDGCVDMFFNCSKLIKAPELPNMIMGYRCYEHMFDGCISLEEAPYLPALELPDNGCYLSMFTNCKKLKYIKADLLYSNSGADCPTADWVSEVADKGVFVKNSDSCFNETGDNGIPEGWTVVSEFPISDGLILWMDGKTLKRAANSTTGYWYQSKSVPSIADEWVMRVSPVGNSSSVTEVCAGKCMRITGLTGGAHVQYSTSSPGYSSNNPFYNIGMTADSDFTYELCFQLDRNQTESSDVNSSLRIAGMTYGSSGSYITAAHRWCLQLDGNGYPYIYSPNTSSNVSYENWQDIIHGTRNIANGLFHHLVFQKQGTTLKLYIDSHLNKIVHNSTWKLDVTTGCMMPGIGRYDGLTTTGASSVRSHPGDYYSMTIYNRALSEDEINANYIVYKNRYDEGYEHNVGKNYNYFYFENLGTTNNYIVLNHYGNSYKPTLYYSYDKLTWNAASWSTNINFNDNKKIYFYGVNNYISYSDSYYTYFSSLENVNVGGEIMSLLVNNKEAGNISQSRVFNYLFKNMTTLISANNLILPPALSTFCYANLFFGCSNLIYPPKLINVGTTAISGCFNYTFSGCTSLKYAPALWDKKLSSDCYAGMFYGCTSLKYIKAMFITDPSTNVTHNWVYNVPSSGIFVKNSAATWTTTGADAIPTGWTVKTTDN